MKYLDDTTSSLSMSECTFFGDFKNSVLEEYEFYIFCFKDSKTLGEFT